MREAAARQGLCTVKPVKPGLTEKLVKSAIMKYRKSNGGENPRGYGDATTYFGFPETWPSINQALRGGGRGLPGGSSLADFLLRHGFAERKPDLTVEMIREAVVKFREANGGENPTKKSGDATPYFGSTETWKNVDSASYNGNRGLPGGSYLSKFCAGIPR